MPFPQYLKRNDAVSYRLGTVFEYTKDERAKVAAALRSQDVYVSDTNSFNTIWFDLTQSYILPHVTTQAVIDAWSSNPMQFWQNQLQFALWCATAGCGVSVKDHMLNETIPSLARSIYRFHIYYQTRSILAEMKCPLPTSDTWNAFSNGIDRHVYQAICGEFKIDYNQAAAACHLSDNHMSSNGLGNTHTSWHRFNTDSWVTYGYYSPNRDSFSSELDSEKGRLDYLSQEDNYITKQEISNGFVWSMLDKSQGFTRAGVERLNDSIRSYTWALLGTQVQTRTSVLGGGPALDAQKQFVAIVEAKIPSTDDLPKSIVQYQEVLYSTLGVKNKVANDLQNSVDQYYAAIPHATSKLDYVLGNELYIVPSNMNLRIGTIAGYNNEIVVATDDMSLGTNDNTNTTRIPPALPVEKGKVDPPPTKNVDIGFNPTHDPPPPPPSPPKNPSSGTPKTQDHDSTKTAITIAAIGVGLGYYFLYK